MGADPNAGDNADRMLVHDAAKTGVVRIMRRLLRDARVDISATTIRENTILHCAAIGGDADIFRMLLDEGPEIDYRDDSGRTAIHLAAGCGREDVVRLILERSKHEC